MAVLDFRKPSFRAFFKKRFTIQQRKGRVPLPDGQTAALQGVQYQQVRHLAEKLLGGTKGLQGLPHKTTYAPKKRCKSITRTIYEEPYLRAYSRQHSERGKRMKKLRQSTVEPVFGSLTQFYGLRKIGVLDKTGAHKVMLMAATAFNLKKYLKKGGGRPSIGILRFQ